MDIYGWLIRTGQHIEIEVKAKGQKPTDRQLDCSRSALGWEPLRSGQTAQPAERVAEAVVAGGQIVWLEGSDYDIKMP